MRSPGVFLFGRHSGTQASFSFVGLTSSFSLRALFLHQHDGEGDWRSICGKFLGTRSGWSVKTHCFYSQSLLRPQLHGTSNCKGGWERRSSCGPKKKRKLHSSTRIKKCSHLLLVPLPEVLSARHQVLLVFILQCVPSVLLPPPLCHFLNPVPSLFLLCFNPFCIPICQARQG